MNKQKTIGVSRSKKLLDIDKRARGGEIIDSVCNALPTSAQTVLQTSIIEMFSKHLLRLFSTISVYFSFKYTFLSAKF